jgi:hypothetical protein
MRGRSLQWDLLWALLMLAGLLTLAWALQRVWLEGGTAGGFAQGVLRRWQITCAVGSSLLFPIVAAFLGAGSIPASAEAETAQAALLTRLRPFEIVAGRLLAALWPIILALTLSCGLWLGIQAIWSPGADWISILIQHLVALGGVYMIGALGALAATRTRPGRSWGRGVSIALCWMAFCVLAVLLADPQIRRMNDPARMIETTLLINPVAGATTALQLDLLRTRWLYERSAAPEYEFAYPAPQATTSLFFGLGLIAQGGTAMRLKRALMRS